MRKLFLIFLVITLICAPAYSFTDTQGHWAERYADELYSLGVFLGDDLGQANLEAYITRAEATALIARLLYGDDLDGHKGTTVFSDVPSTAWYYNTVSFAYGEGIINGTGNGQFSPQNNIKREEIVLILYRALELSPIDITLDFTDVGKDYVYYTQIASAVSAGLIRGLDDGRFAPAASAKRGEVVAMLARITEPWQSVATAPPSPTPTPPTPTPPAAQASDESPPANIAGTPVNLIWHQIYNKDIKVTGNTMNGINVVSPTWFKVFASSKGASASYETKLAGDNNLYFQDLSNGDYIHDATAVEGYDVWPLLKTDFTTSTARAFLDSESARADLIEKLRGLVQKHSLGGINLDFENMYINDRDKYTDFVREMSVMTREEGIILSVDVTKYEITSATYSMCYDRAGLSQYADYLILMGYDQNGTWSKTAGSVSDMPWVEGAIKGLLSEVPKEKLILAVPFYARLWEERGGVVVKTEARGMKSLRDIAAENNAAIFYDERSGQNYTEWQSGQSTFKIWFEDERSMINRINLIKKYELAGMAIWSKGFEDPQIYDVIKEHLFN